MKHHTTATERMERLIDIGIALSSEKNTPRLLEQILLGAKAITAADGGTLYSVQEDGTVRMEIIRTDSLDFAMGGTTGVEIPFPPIPLFSENGEANLHNVVTSAVHKDIIINIPDAYHFEGYDLSGPRAFDQKTGYYSKSFLTVPMKNHEGDIIGVLQLLNAQDESGTIIPFSDEAQRLTASLASQAAIALTNQRLIVDLKELLESLIKLVADAIDEKSPYTGGHCRRVPVITMLLADAAARITHGPLAEFQMSDDDRYELEIAAWLHDCGKITTPEYVVDKSTKLETIYDRIHLVEERIERLKMEAEKRWLHRKVEALEAGESPDPAWEGAMRAECARLDDELAFLRKANLGGEFMSEEDQARVGAIGARRLRDCHGEETTLLSEEEVANLTIAKGTLTDEEREVINHHIVATINMLEALPFPKHLKNVPEYAGGHHERVDGQGYPRGLTGEQMSVQARVMAIADIFEALTAKDRPYKPGKKLSETLRILGFLKQEGHIDPELFDIFVREKVYQSYAEQFLDPEQIDEVDEAKIPGYSPA